MAVTRTDSIAREAYNSSSDVPSVIGRQDRPRLVDGALSFLEGRKSAILTKSA